MSLYSVNCNLTQPTISISLSIYEIQLLRIIIYDERSANYYLSVHPANQLVTSMPKRNIIRRATNSIFSLNVKTEYLLALPYDTKCFNYEDNIGKGKDAFKSVKECEDKCKIIMNSSYQLNFNQLISKQFQCDCPIDCKKETVYLDLDAWSENGFLFGEYAITTIFN